jgi:hypothetical protein
VESVPSFVSSPRYETKHKREICYCVLLVHFHMLLRI